MKIAVILIFQLLFLESMYSQANTLGDILPLEVGNKWTYDYRFTFRGQITHTTTEKDGIIEYKIVDVDSTADSLIWHFKQKRVINSWTSGSSGSSVLVDSSNFEIIEINSGNHELIAPVLDKESVFTFERTDDNSLKFYRYYPTDSSGNAYYQFLPVNFSFHEINIACKKDTGIVDANSSLSTTASSEVRSFSLLEFQRPLPGPYLSIPEKNISDTLLFGKSKDLTITIKNIGSEVLTISNISSSNPKITIVNFSKAIPSIEEGAIKISMYSGIEESISSIISINCNSPSTDNTLNAKVKFIGAVLISLSPPGIFFNTVFNGQSFNTICYISNKGNLPLKIDSSRTSPPFYSKNSSFLINPNETIPDTIDFVPQNSSYHIGKIVYYSNANTSPHEVRLEGQSIENAKIGLDANQITFGKINVGETVETEIQITNYGTEIVKCNMWLNSGWHSDKENSFSLADNGTIEISPSVPYKNKILFTPQSSEFVADTLLVQIWRSEYNGTISLQKVPLMGNLTDYLNQNYPNPFNSDTKIKFQISTNSKVQLKVYNILGEEISTLVDGFLEIGSYEHIFNSNNLSSGVYFYRLVSDNYVETKKFVLMK
jgi:hypothetical protein